MMISYATGRQLTLRKPYKAHRRGNIYRGLLWAEVERRGFADRVMTVINRLAGGDQARAAEARVELMTYWSFEINRRATSRFGLCSSPAPLRPNGAVEVSEVLLRPENAAQFEQTFLHEVAHALVNIFFVRTRRGPVAGHGREWRHVMVLLGLRPDRCATGDNAAGEELRARKMAKAQHVYACTRCSVQIPRTRLLNMSKVYHHRGCGGRIVLVA